MKHDPNQLDLLNFDNIEESEPKWRSDKPTTKQWNYLQKLRKAVKSPKTDIPETKGKASDEISELNKVIAQRIQRGQTLCINGKDQTIQIQSVGLSLDRFFRHVEHKHGLDILAADEYEEYGDDPSYF
jgi:hypothetical protein